MFAFTAGILVTIGWQWLWDREIIQDFVMSEFNIDLRPRTLPKNRR